ncbi:hypothetical protein AGMMS49938_16860 [Fibrobacterales bacterium]|nr:hypothetical protein AGMMS49938_16860 [Fibrobacterales bacterium]
MYIIGMNQKNLLIASVILNVGLLVLIFLVKGNVTKQAQEHVKKTLENSKFQMAQVSDNIQNNNLLWSLVDSTWKSSDKSIAFVKKLADASKLPRCSGKPCEGDAARLTTTNSKITGGREFVVRGGRYFFKVIYDAKDKFVSIDASDLLGKSAPVVEQDDSDEEE